MRDSKKPGPKMDKKPQRSRDSLVREEDTLRNGFWYRREWEKYKNIMDCAPDGILTVDLKGTIVSCNRAFAESTGYPAEAFLNKHFSQLPTLRGKQDAANYLKLFSALIRGKKPSPFQAEWVSKNGMTHYAEVHVALMKTGRKITGIQAIIRDIGDRIAAEQRLTESEERFRRVSELTSDYAYAYRVNPDGELVNEWVTGAFKKITGYSPGELHALGRWEHLVHPDDMEIRRKQLQVLFSGKSSTVVYRILTKDKKTRWMRDYSRPIMDRKTKRLVYIYGAVQDITTRKAAEEARRAAEKEYRTVIENANEAIFVAQDGMLKFVNPKTLEIIGYSRKAATSMPLADLIHPEDRDMVVDRHLRRVQGMQVPDVYPLRIIDKKGKVKWVEIRVVVIEWEGRPATLSLASDITERKAAEDALIESENRFRRLAENAIDIIYRYEILPEFKFEYISPAIKDITGYAPEEFYADPMLGLRIVHPEDRPVLEAVNRGKIARGSPAVIRWIKKDGGVVWTEAKNAPIYDDNGRLAAIEGISRDITSSKLAQDQIRASLEEKEILLKEIHHRVKNNMQIVTSLLRLQATKIQNPKVRELLKESNNRIRSMALIHESLYKSENLAKIDFANYAQRLSLHLFQTYKINTPRIKLITAIEPLDLDINIAIPCGLLLNELITNSLKHAFKGIKKGEIIVRVESGKQVGTLIGVTDNGIGLPSDIDIQNPVSLGLQLVNDLVRQIDGKTTVDCSKGTSFTIVF